MSTVENKLEFFEVGDKTSLICTDAAVGEVAMEMLRDLGYKFHTADSSEIAIERTRYTPYDIIIIQETFAGSTLKSNPVLNYFAALPMAQRRASMLVLIGTTFKTLDAMQALAQSVQLVVNTVDLPNLAAVLKKSRAEFETTYKIYKDVVGAMGER